MALMLADERSGDFESIGDFGFTEPVPPLPRVLVVHRRGSTPATPSRSTIRLPPRGSLAEEVEFWRDQGIYYFVPCVFEGAAIAVLALGRKEIDEPFNSEDLALLTAVAGQVATAIENGRLYRQLHLKAEELGRMREFNENILESLDDGLVVFDADERIVRWNRALETFLRRARARTRSAGRWTRSSTRRSSRRCERRAGRDPRGATLFKVPLTAALRRGGELDDRLAPAGQRDGRAAAESDGPRRRRPARFC